MITYQDLIAVGDSDKQRMDFVLTAIARHKTSKLYKTAEVAEEYARHENRTINQYQKLLYTVSGKAVPDNWSANYKMASNFFNRFVTQQVQFLLGNGVTWQGDAENRLGEDFDTKLQKAGKYALIGAVSFGFFNLDHIEVFKVTEFVPLHDEENGALAAGIRFWQIDSTKPLRATLYEIDGYTEYIWINGKGEIRQQKRAYKINTRYTEADGLEIYDGENYPAFPIVPLWGNTYHQSELTGMREQIDAYDLIKSGFANDLDDVSQIYWTISNAGGMDDIDLAQFVQRMKTVKAASVQTGEQVQAHSIDVPYSAREALLERLKKDMYTDYMALDVEKIAAGAVTATQIESAYDPLNSKADEWEFCVIDFIQGILTVAGIEDVPTFTRSIMINRTETIQQLIACGQYLDSQYITEKLLNILGDGDQVEDVLKRMADNEVERLRIQREAFAGGEDE